MSWRCKPSLGHITWQEHDFCLPIILYCSKYSLKRQACLLLNSAKTHFFNKIQKARAFFHFSIKHSHTIPLKLYTHQLTLLHCALTTLQLWKALKGHFDPATWKAPSNKSSLIIICRRVGTRHPSSQTSGESFSVNGQLNTQPLTQNGMPFLDYCWCHGSLI